MSVDYTAYTIIGVKVPKSRLYEKKNVRNCSHPQSDSKFCPECGKPMWQETEKPIRNFDAEDEKYNGLDVIYEDYESPERYIGYALSRGSYSDCSCLSIEELETVIKDAKLKLGPLYDEKLFGVWTALNCSY